MNLYLASTSPFRKKLLEKLKVPFKAINPEVDESEYKNKGLNAFDLSCKLSDLKAKAAFDKIGSKDAVVIGGDQVCVQGEKIYSKAKDQEHAKKQLSELTGKTHQLITTYSIATKDGIKRFTNITELKMQELSDDEISAYVEYDKPMGCAGSYKIEDAGIGLFEEIKTDDFTAIIGLPLMRLSKDLKSMGFNIWNDQSNANS